jgi:hypothetical protein
MIEKFYSSLFLPAFMGEHIKEEWQSKQLQTNRKDPRTGWLNGKWKVALHESKYPDERELILAVIDMLKHIIHNLPCTGQSRGTNQIKYHEARIYCLINQSWDMLPLLNPTEAPDELQNLQVVDGVHPYQASDVGYILAALSMQDRMYSDECELVAWAATKFDEKSYAGDVVLRFYIRGESQLLYNELKWYLLTEFNQWFPKANQFQRFMYIKNRMPIDMIYYNILYDAKKVIEELKTRLMDLSEGDPNVSKSVDISSSDGITPQRKLTPRERKDIKNSIAFYVAKRKEDEVSSVLQSILDNY